MNRENANPLLGFLRNDNPRSNPNGSPRCGARTRFGPPCCARAMANGRCHRHGGKSTGLRTKEGLHRLRVARTMQGFYSDEGREFRHTVAALFAQGRWFRLLATVREARIDAPPDAERPMRDRSM